MRLRWVVAWFSLWILSSGAVAATNFNQITVADVGGHLSDEKKTYQFTALNASFFEAHFDGIRDLHVWADVDQSTEASSYFGTWSFDFFFPNDERAAGTYTGLPGGPSLVWVSPPVNLRTCIASEGQFTVSTLVLMPGTSLINQLSLNFDVKCPEQITGTIQFTRGTSGSGGGTSGGSGGSGGIGGLPGGGTSGTPQPTPVPPPPPPPPALYMTIPTDVAVEPLTIGNAATQTVKVSTLVNSTFDSDVQISATSDASESEDLHLTVTPATIAAPGAGDAELTISTGPWTMPRTYRVTVSATGGQQTVDSSFLVNVDCNPPFILGTDQPRNVTATRGGDFDLSVIASGSRPFTYQWYRGVPGMTRWPVAGATNAKMTTSTLANESYWVRVSNACGSADSNAANVTTTNALKFNKH